MTGVVVTTTDNNKEYSIKNYDILDTPQKKELVENLVNELNSKTGFVSSSHGGGNTKEMTSDLIKMIKEGFILRKYHGKLISLYGSRSSYCKFISKVLGLKKHYILIRLKLLRLDIPRIVNLYYSNVIKYFDISMLGNFPPNKQDEILHALLHETNRKDTREKRVEFYKKFTYGNNNDVERKKMFGGKKEEEEEPVGNLLTIKSIATTTTTNNIVRTNNETFEVMMSINKEKEDDKYNNVNKIPNMQLPVINDRIEQQQQQPVNNNKEEKKFYDDLEIVVPEKEEPQPPNTIRERTKEEEFLHWKKRNGFS